MKIQASRLAKCQWDKTLDILSCPQKLYNPDKRRMPFPLHELPKKAGVSLAYPRLTSNIVQERHRRSCGGAQVSYADKTHLCAPASSLRYGRR